MPPSKQDVSNCQTYFCARFIIAIVGVRGILFKIIFMQQSQAAPVKAYSLPPVFERFKMTLIARDPVTGKRDYIKVLRLLETHGIDDVEKGLYMAFDHGIFSVEAIKHLILQSLETKAPKLSLTNLPHVPIVCVHKTNTSSYMSLLGGHS